MKNDKRGFDITEQKVVRYSYTSKDGGVFRADGKCVGNYLSGDFRLTTT